MKTAGWDFMAKVYSFLEYMTCGRALAESRRFHLKHCLACERILILGDGNGRFLHELYASGFQGEVVSVDCSQGMIAEAKKRCVAYTVRIKWIECGIEKLSLNELGKFDCLITHYFWDVFEAEKGGGLLRKALCEVDGLSYVGMADFSSADGLKGWRALRQRVILNVLFACFRSITGIENRAMWSVDSVLQSSGWSQVKEGTFGDQLVWASWWTQDSCIEAVDL